MIWKYWNILLTLSPDFKISARVSLYLKPTIIYAPSSSMISKSPLRMKKVKQYEPRPLNYLILIYTATELRIMLGILSRIEATFLHTICANSKI